MVAISPSKIILALLAASNVLASLASEENHKLDGRGLVGQGHAGGNAQPDSIARKLRRRIFGSPTAPALIKRQEDASLSSSSVSDNSTSSSVDSSTVVQGDAAPSDATSSDLNDGSPRNGAVSSDPAPPSTTVGRTIVSTTSTPPADVPSSTPKEDQVTSTDTNTPAPEETPSSTNTPQSSAVDTSQQGPDEVDENGQGEGLGAKSSSATQVSSTPVEKPAETPTSTPDAETSTTSTSITHDLPTSIAVNTSKNGDDSPDAVSSTASSPSASQNVVSTSDEAKPNNAPTSTLTSSSFTPVVISIDTPSSDAPDSTAKNTIPSPTPKDQSTRTDDPTATPESRPISRSTASDDDISPTSSRTTSSVPDLPSSISIPGVTDSDTDTSTTRTRASEASETSDQPTKTSSATDEDTPSRTPLSTTSISALPSVISIPGFSIPDITSTPDDPTSRTKPTSTADASSAADPDQVSRSERPDPTTFRISTTSDPVSTSDNVPTSSSSDDDQASRSVKPTPTSTDNDDTPSTRATVSAPQSQDGQSSSDDSAPSSRQISASPTSSKGDDESSVVGRPASSSPGAVQSSSAGDGQSSSRPGVQPSGSASDQPTTTRVPGTQTDTASSVTALPSSDPVFASGTKPAASSIVASSVGGDGQSSGSAAPAQSDPSTTRQSSNPAEPSGTGTYIFNSSVPPVVGNATATYTQTQAQAASSAGVTQSSGSASLTVIGVPIPTTTQTGAGPPSSSSGTIGQQASTVLQQVSSAGEKAESSSINYGYVPTSTLLFAPADASSTATPTTTSSLQEENTSVSLADRPVTTITAQISFPSDLPAKIVPQGAPTSAPENTALISILLQAGTLPWNFVSQNESSASQLLYYMPQLIANALNISADQVVNSALVGYQAADFTSGASTVLTAWLGYIPADQVDQLASQLSAPNSDFYHPPQPQLQQLAAQVDPSLPLNSFSGSSGTNSKTGSFSVSNGDGSNHNKTTIIAVVASFGSVIVLLTAFLGFRYVRRKKAASLAAVPASPQMRQMRLGTSPAHSHTGRFSGAFSQGTGRPVSSVSDASSASDRSSLSDGAYTNNRGVSWYSGRYTDMGSDEDHSPRHTQLNSEDPFSDRRFSSYSDTTRSVRKIKTGAVQISRPTLEGNSLML